MRISEFERSIHFLQRNFLKSQIKIKLRQNRLNIQKLNCNFKIIFTITFSPFNILFRSRIYIYKLFRIELHELIAFNKILQFSIPTASSPTFQSSSQLLENQKSTKLQSKYSQILEKYKSTKLHSKYSQLLEKYKSTKLHSKYFQILEK